MKTKWLAETQRVETIWTFKRDGKSRSYRSSIRCYTPGEFRHLFALAGFELEASYGNLDGSKYSRGSRRLHLLGRKI